MRYHIIMSKPKNKFINNSKKQVNINNPVKDMFKRKIKIDFE